MKKKILTTSYSPCIEGSYGIVAREIFTRLHALNKYEIVSHGWFHVDANYPVPWKVIPTNTKINDKGQRELDMSDKFGEQSFQRMMEIEQPDIVWALGDFYMLQHIGALKQKYPSTQFIGYIAVDGQPWHGGQTEAFKNFDLLVSLTNFGSRILSSVTGKPINHIYHGVNTSVFFPLEDERKKLIKKSAIPNSNDDTFVIGWVGRNQFRKQIWKLWELMHYLVHGDYIVCKDCTKVTLKEYDAQFGIPREIGTLQMYDADYDYSFCWHCRSKNIENGQKNDNIYAWSHMANHQGDGWDQNQLGDLWRIRQKVLSTSGITNTVGLKANALNEIYNIFDIFYCMSGGEGFGIPVLESMACKVPPFYTNYSGHAEVAKDCGVPINCNWMAEMNSCYFRALADTADAIGKLLPYIKDKSKLNSLKEKSYIKAKDITWDNIAKEWDFVLSKIAANHKKSTGIIL